MYGRFGGYGKGKGQKRQRPNNPNPDHASAKKGKFEESEEFKRIADDVAPILGKIIDAYGGVCSYALISLDQEWLEAIGRHPNSSSIKVKKVADLFTDYMVPLDGHHVATAMGYEQGLVNDDGSVDKTKMKKKWDEKKEADKKIGIIRGPPPPKSGNTPTTRLQQASSKFNKIAMQPDQRAFDEAFRELEAARAEAFSGGGFRDGPVVGAVGKASQRKAGLASGGTLKEKLEPFADYIRKMFASKQLKAHESMRLGDLANDPEAKRIRDQAGATNTKMVKILEEFPEYFSVAYDDINKTLVTVTLTEEGQLTEEPEEGPALSALAAAVAKSKNKDDSLDPLGYIF